MNHLPNRATAVRRQLALALVLVATLAVTSVSRAATAPKPVLAPAVAAAEPVDEVFKRALFEEEGHRDYEAAMRGYEEVVRALDNQRRLAATAVFRLGECYRKLNRTNDAIAQFERVLRDFAAEETLARLSRQNLGALGVSPAPAASSATPASSTASTEARASLVADYNRLVEGLRRVRELDKDVEQQAIAALALHDDDGLRRMVENLSKLHEQLERLTREPNGPITVYHTAIPPSGSVALELNSPITRDTAAKEIPRQHAWLREKIEFILRLESFRLQTLRDSVAAFDRSLQTAESGPAATASAGPTQDLARDAALLESQLEALVKLDPAQLPARLRVLLPAACTPRFDGLRNEIDAAAVRRASLLVTLTEDHPDVKAVEASLLPLRRQLDDEIAAILAAQRLRLETLRAAIGRLAVRADSPGPNAGASTNAPEASLTSQEADEIRRIQGLVANSPDLINALTGASGPLHKAVEKGQLTVARYLLDHGARVDLRDRDRHTPLQLAAATGHKAIAELLLDRGAPIDATDKSGETPLHAAAQAGFVAVTELLLARGAPIDAFSALGTPLLMAAGQDRLEVARLLLGKGANPNARPEGKYPPLTAADSPAMVALLLRHKADPNLDQGVRLVRAVGQREEEVVKLLLAAGASPDAEPRDTVYSRGQPLATGSTPLLLAIQGKEPSRAVTELLLRQKADVNRPSSRTGLTPLHAAAESDDDWFLPSLLDHGGNPNLETHGGGILLERLHPAEFVRWRTPQPNTSPEAVAFSGNRWNRLRLLVERGADPNRAFSDGLTLAHCAACWGDREELDFLAKHRARFEVTDPDGTTPLMVAAANRNTNAVAWLLSAGVDRNAANEQGNTALHFAAAAESVPLVKQLLDAGVDPLRTNRLGLTAARLALGRPLSLVPAGRLGVPALGSSPARGPFPAPSGPPSARLLEVLKLLPDAPEPKDQPGTSAGIPAQPRAVVPIPARPSPPAPTAIIHGAAYRVVPLPPGKSVTLMDALTEAEVLRRADIDLRRVRLRRAEAPGESLPTEPQVINVEAIMKTGDRSSDPELRVGDRIEIREKLLN